MALQDITIGDFVKSNRFSEDGECTECPVIGVTEDGVIVMHPVKGELRFLFYTIFYKRTLQRTPIDKNIFDLKRFKRYQPVPRKPKYRYTPRF